jgi:hypothetical protein
MIGGIMGAVAGGIAAYAPEALGVEDLIDPRDTRPLLIRYLEAAIPRLAHDLGPKPRYGVRP